MNLYHFFRGTSFLLALIILTFASVQAQSTAFVYQGKINDGAMPASGVYEMQFSLHSAVSGMGNQLGSTVTNTNVQVTGGIFSVELDFGNQFSGADRWIEISVKKPVEPGYTVLTPRQKIASVPYAVKASGSANLRPDASQVSISADTESAVLDVTGAQDDGNGNAIEMSRFRFNHNGGFYASGDMDNPASNVVPIQGPGTRMMWFPGKAAFRAGRIIGTQWDTTPTDNIGAYSTAFGENTRASQSNTFAAGKSAVASANSAVALGEGVIASGMSSVALGYGAHTNARQGSFVFADRSAPLVYLPDGSVDQTFSDMLRAGVNNSANWRVSGGFRIFTSSNLTTGMTFQSGATVSNWGQSNAVISTSTGAFLSTSGVWTNVSSRNMKTNFMPVDSRSILQKVLQLPVTNWNYKVDSANIRHIGPMAQDFYSAFGVGADDEHINSVDTSGVAFAAIQGLNEELKDRDKKIESQQQQINSLQQQMTEMKKLLCLQTPDAAICRQ